MPPRRAFVDRDASVVHVALDPTIYTGSRRHRRRLITDDVMTAIQSLSGQAHTLLPVQRYRQSRPNQQPQPELHVRSNARNAHQPTTDLSLDPPIGRVEVARVSTRKAS